VLNQTCAVAYIQCGVSVPRSSPAVRVDNNLHTPHADGVVSRDDLTTKLRQTLAKHVKSKTALAEIEPLIAALQLELSIQSNGSTESEPWQSLQQPPPPAAEVFSKHWQRIGTHLTPQSFLQHYWGEYTDQSCLLLTHLRAHDSHLVSALYKIVRRESPTDLDLGFRKMGILTRMTVLHPPPHLENRAKHLQRFVGEPTSNMGLPQQGAQLPIHHSKQIVR
jgi:hypothetical protein